MGIFGINRNLSALGISLTWVTWTVILHTCSTIILKTLKLIGYYRATDNYKKSKLLNMKVTKVSDIIQN